MKPFFHLPKPVLAIALGLLAGAAALPAQESSEELSLKQLKLERAKLALEQQQLELLKKEIQLQQEKSTMDMIETNDTVTLNLEADVLFPFGESSISEEGLPMLQRVTNLLGQLNVDRILVEGHTDSKGSEEANHQLSHARADSVKAVLVKNGIPSDIIETKGYGKSKPIAHNTLPDGRDFPEGRAQNRRVEIEVFKRSAEDRDRDDLPEVQVISEEGSSTIRVQTDRVFDYESRELESGAGNVLDRPIAILKRYPKETVAIEVHTDNDLNRKADDDALSQDLAKELKAHLVDRGISEDRIKVTGRGHEEPLDYNTNPDGSDFPEGRAHNRRIEFKLDTPVNE